MLTFLVVIIWNLCICIHKANMEHTQEYSNEPKVIEVCFILGEEVTLELVQLSPCSKESQPIVQTLNR